MTLVLGVVGAGTMGAGIAQLCLTAGAETILVDTASTARERAEASIRAGLEKLVERGRMTERDAAASMSRLLLTADMAEVSRCALVIEAVPEDLDLKVQVLNAVAELVGLDCVLATNTSSIPVAAIAAQIPGSHRVLGMHFFNPPPIMKLLELIPTAETDSGSIELARRVGTEMGKSVITAADVPGFIVNRCARPFSLEALQLLRERIADASTIDRLCRNAAGFTMGPFTLLDLVGLDVSLDVARSFYGQSFGEPRWRPSPIIAGMVASGRLGRKSGSGFYQYGDLASGADSEPSRAAWCKPSPAWGGTVRILGETPLARWMTALVAASPWEMAPQDDRSVDMLIDCGITPTAPSEDVPVLTACFQSLVRRNPSGIGFFAVAPPNKGSSIEVTSTERTPQSWKDLVCSFWDAMGVEPVAVADAPGLATARIVAQLINEATFALAEGVGSRADIDTGMRLGLNHPRGPFEWLELLEVATVVEVLDALRAEIGDERYRAAPLLRKWSTIGLPDTESRTPGS